MLIPRIAGIKVESSEDFITLCGGDIPTTMEKLLSSLEDIVERVERICNEGGRIRASWPNFTTLAESVYGNGGEKERFSFTVYDGPCSYSKCPQRFICGLKNYILQLRTKDRDLPIRVFSSLPIIMDLKVS